MKLQDLRNRAEKIKNEIALKEGEKNAIIKTLMDKFGFKTVDEAYDHFDFLKSECEQSKQLKESLTKEIDDSLSGYGY